MNNAETQRRKASRMKLRLFSPSTSLLFGVALTCGVFVLRFWRLGAMPLFGDEAYYLLWADRLAPAYFDHPAAIALLLKLSTLVGGHSELGIRWLNALLSVAGVPLAYLLGRRYVSEAGGLIAAVAVTLGPVYVITGRIAYPDSLQAFFLLLNLLACVPLLTGKETPARWAWFGLTLALLLNVKLSSGFYALALALYVLGWRRDLFRRPGLWLGVGLAALGLIPIVSWNATHHWAMVRWAVYQGKGFGLPQPGLAASLARAWGYLTFPAVLIAGLAALAAILRLLEDNFSPKGASFPGRSAVPSHTADWRLLAIVAVCLAAPILLSQANSPRNLGLGLLALWPLAGLFSAHERSAPLELGFPRQAGSLRSALAGATWLLCLPLALFGAGTAIGLAAPTRLPYNIAVPAIRADQAGWPQFAAAFPLPDETLAFAVDYSIAGQIAYYARHPVYSSAAQYRMWGVPEADQMIVYSLNFFPPELVTERLRADFAQVSGPKRWRYSDSSAEKTVFIWNVNGRQATMSRVLDDLDYLTLAQQAGQR